MSQEPRRFVQVIDLYSRHPAELERRLNHWRTSSSAREHVVGVKLGRDEADSEHLVLQVEYEPSVPASGDASEMASADASEMASADAAQVIALLDRPPRFRPES